MTIASLICLTATFCVNPATIATVTDCGPTKTCVSIVADQRFPPSIDLPIAEVLRRLDDGPVAVTWAPKGGE